MTHIQFLTNEAGKVEGLAYAGFETFRGSPYTSCARETGQNSRDASKNKGPVRVRFNLLTIPRSDVPFADQLERSIECCLSGAHDEKTSDHLNRALKTIRAPFIKILEISDENTIGLTGPTNDPRSVFSALVKGDGITNKSDPTSAGSFGIGKNAAYAVSDLQVVIYTTCYRDKGELLQFAAQGRLRLISHFDGKTNYSAEGYWGGPNFSAIHEQEQVPAWMRRNSQGTSIFSIGFRDQGNWKDRMILSLVTNFFLAIERNEIEFKVEDYAINKITLDTILRSTQIEEIARSVDELDRLERARKLVECMRSEVARSNTISIPGLGAFSLRVLVKEGMPREVHILRNGIYITDNFARFSEPLKRFPSTKEFIAVLEPATTDEGRKPSTLLKQMENPAHDAFEPERIVDDTQRNVAKAQVKLLSKKAREFIKEVAMISDDTVSDVDELSRFFADAGNRHSGQEEPDPSKYKYGIPRKGRVARPPGAIAPGNSKGDIKIHTQRESDKAKQKNNRSLSSTLKDIRSVIPNQKDLRRRTIYFTSDVTGNVEISLAAVGLATDVELAITSTNFGDTKSGRITVLVHEHERTSLDVEFAEPYGGPIELRATTATS